MSIMQRLPNLLVTEYFLTQ